MTPDQAIAALREIFAARTAAKRGDAARAAEELREIFNSQRTDEASVARAMDAYKRALPEERGAAWYGYLRARGVRLADDPPPAVPAWFALGDFDADDPPLAVVRGWDTGMRWNGWAAPLVDFDGARAFVAGMASIGATDACAHCALHGRDIDDPAAAIEIAWREDNGEPSRVEVETAYVLDPDERDPAEDPGMYVGAFDIGLGLTWRVMDAADIAAVGAMALMRELNVGGPHSGANVPPESARRAARYLAECLRGAWHPDDGVTAGGEITEVAAEVLDRLNLWYVEACEWSGLDPYATAMDAWREVDPTLLGTFAEQLSVAIETSKAGPAGWTFGYEYPGYYSWAHTSGVVVNASPDWDGAEGTITIEWHDASGALVASEVVPWPESERRARPPVEGYLAIMAPYFARALAEGGR